MRRGRPRHDDVLTPREWQVLDLLRQGLTNEQIAARLGVSPDTAKFHVSEILGKLGVETRQQAAAWQGRPRGVPIAGLPAAIARLVGSLSPLQLAGAAVIAGAAIGLAALAAGLLLTESRRGAGGPAFAPDGRSGIEQVDAFIDSLLNDDASALARRFSGVRAREGSYDFGGIYNPSDVPSDEWTSRLAAAQRVLHAVVQDPPEGYRTPGPGGVPLLMTPRDFDVLLIVDETGGASSAWRFSLLESHIIDLVITPVSQTPSPPNMRPNFGLRGLMPNPVAEPASFLVLPPEESWPAPTPYAASGISEPAPAPVDAPTFAPDGRTGDKTLDAIIEALLNDDAQELAERFAGLAARERELYTGGEERRVAVSEWTERLAEAERSLYAVYTDRTVDARIALAVEEGGAAAENWQLGIDDGRLVEVEIHLLPPYAEAQAQGDRLYYLAHFPLWPAGPPGDYYRFYVLPPENRLPKPPAARPLSASTGGAGVDRLLSLLQARDAAGLRAAIEATGWPSARHCGSSEKMDEMTFPEFLDEWLTETTESDLMLHAVARVPEGYPISARHVVILVSETDPYSWKTTGIFERDGNIVAILPNCGSPASLYPPGRFILAPPPAGLPLDSSRRTSLPEVAPVLDAVYARDATALAALIDYPKVPCGIPYGGLGTLLECPAGSQPGALVQSLRTGPHGERSLAKDAPGLVIGQVAEGALYAVIESRDSPGAVAVIFARYQDVRSAGQPPQPFTYGVAALVVRDGRLIDYQRSGPGPIDVVGWLAQYAQPDFLLPPP
jgi:DNA-binding CsgD family transcriptional regulator